METNQREELLTKLQKIVDTKCPGIGSFESSVPDLRYARRSNEKNEIVHCFYDSCIALVLQCSKEVTVGSIKLAYGRGSMILVTVDMPSSYRIITDDENSNFLALSLHLDLNLIAQLSSKMPVDNSEIEPLAFKVEEANDEILGCLLRLVNCDDDPLKAKILADPIKQELYFHLLRGPFGLRLRNIFGRESYGKNMIHMVEFLKKHYKENFSIDELAAKANMASPTFFKHFKKFTSISPLQYQKYLRLHEARRLMLVVDYNASNAAFEVGYESQQQFNREYKRLFGLPPKEHINELKKEL